MDLAAELARFGPSVSGAPVSAEEARAYCRRLAQTHYENFTVVTRLVPRRLRQPLCNIYAYCRWADDLADERVDIAEPLSLLDWWEHQLDAAYAGQASHPVFVALSETIRDFDLPRQPLADLLVAFRRDQVQTRYETLADLVTYCEKSANPVGRMVLCLGRSATPDNVRLADSVCTGLQLANFWQDVNRDLDMGRIYLPQEDCRRFGYSHDDLRARVTNAPFLELLKFEVERARQWLSPWKHKSLPELREFPLRIQVDIELFARGGERILDRIAAIGYRVWDRRPVVTKGDVLRLFLGCCRRAMARRIFRSA